MKKNIVLILIINFFIGIFNLNSVNAITIVNPAQYSQIQKEANLGDMLNFFGDLYNNKIPNSYKYIDVKIKGINKNSRVYDSIQKLIYVEKLENKDVKINPNRKIKAIILYNFASKFSNLNLINDWEISRLKNRNANFDDFEKIKKRLNVQKVNLDFDNEVGEIKSKKQIFSDVYKTLNTRFYGKEKVDKIKMIEKATEALAKETGDKHTVYFPPTDNKSFNESLSGEYEGIGAYVEMEKPGIFMIVSPISDSPAEKAGLKGGDIVLKVDGKEVTKENSIKEVVSWIKGVAGTKVVLNIKRGTRIFDVVVTRGHIILKEIEYKKINSTTFYIKLKFFGPSISREFTKSLEELKKDKKIKKIIFDLRGNGGGYLAQAVGILSHIIPKGEDTVYIKYLDRNNSYKSRGYDEIDFSKYKLIVLENGGTASASEIFIGTLKDYFPETKIIGEKSYGKGSVQTIKQYSDGSSLKYTIAKWFTGKSHTGIDGIGIKPDIEIKMEKYGVDENKDKQLQKALKLR